MEREGFWKTAVAVMGTYFLFDVLCVPLNAFLLATGGFLWRFWIGFGIMWTAHMAAAFVCFTVGRALLANMVRERLERREAFKHVLDVMHGGTETFRMALLLRFSPLPQSIDNYILSVTEIPFHIYVTTATIGFVPMLAEIVWMGSLARDAVDAGKSESGNHLRILLK